eukprot:symbB.v1.2.010885.t2/scaffold721.1/size169143/3
MEVTSARQQRLSTKEALAKLERELLSSKEETKTAQVEQERLKECLEKQRQVQRGLEEDLEMLEASKVEAEQRWEQITEDMNSRLTEVQEEKRELQVKLSEVELKLDVDQEKVIEELQAKWHRSQAEKNKLEGQMSQFRQEADEKVKNLNAALQSEKASKLSCFLLFVQADLKNKSMTAAEEVKLLQAEKNKLEGQMSQFRQEADEKVKNLNAALQSEKAARTALEKQLEEDLKKVQADLKNKSMTAAEEMKLLQAEKNKLEGQMSQFRQEADEKVKNLNAALQSEKAARTALEKQLEEDLKKVQADLKNKSMTAAEEVKLLQAMVDMAARTALEKQLEEDLKKVQADLKNKSMTAAEEGKLLQAEKNKLEGQMSQFRQEADEKAKNLNAALQTALEKQLEEDLKKVQADLKNKSMTAAEEVKVLKAKRKELEKDLSLLRKEAAGEVKRMNLTLELEKEKVLQAQRDTEVVGIRRALAVDDWPSGASLSDADVDALHLAHHVAPRSVLGCHRLKGDESKSNDGSENVDLFVFRVWHQSLERDWEAEEQEILLELEGVEQPVAMRRRCAWLYEAVVFLPADWMPSEDDAAQAPVGGVLRLPRYRLHIPEEERLVHDAFGYVGFLLAEVEIDHFQGGRFPNVADALGCHCVCAGGVFGLRFATWAPRAVFVSVVGEWNHWDGRASPMAKRFRAEGGGFSGLWEVFVPFGELADIPFGKKYGYKIHTMAGTDMVKMDPYAQEMEVPSDMYHSPVLNASVVSRCDDSYRAEPFEWSDEAWMTKREERGRLGTALLQPMAVYEVHLPSWRRGANGEVLGYRELAEQLVDHVKALKFNWVELMALAHHPFQGSWGYQVSAYFSVYSLLGSPDDLKYLIDKLHEAEIGVIMDFVPAHFCRDQCSICDFDGTPTFEYEDPREGEQRQWGTKVFNFRRNEVRSFLQGAVLFWAERYHIDGFRCDAISSMLYRNFGREEGQWIPNEHGTVSNLECISLLQSLNAIMKELWPGVIMIAEESTAWTGVTSLRPAEFGLGFDLKWDLGWMNDTLVYFEEPSWNKASNHEKLTLRAGWMDTERYVVPLSHDEVANMKGSMVEKMGRKELSNAVRTWNFTNACVYCVPAMVIKWCFRAAPCYSWVKNMDKVENGIVINLLIGMNVMSLCVKAYAYGCQI